MVSRQNMVLFCFGIKKSGCAACGTREGQTLAERDIPAADI